jgi:hypothetical protein
MDQDDLEWLESLVLDALRMTAGITKTTGPGYLEQDNLDTIADTLWRGLLDALKIPNDSVFYSAIMDLAMDLTSFDLKMSFEERVRRRDDAIDGSARLMLLSLVEAIQLTPEYGVVAIGHAGDIVLKRPVVAAA